MLLKTLEDPKDLLFVVVKPHQHLHIRNENREPKKYFFVNSLKNNKSVTC